MLFYRDGLEEEIDGPPRVFKNGEGHTIEAYKVDGKERFFVTLAGTHWCAHGNTLAEAIADAIWKDPARRPTLEALKAEIQKAGKERLITLPEFRVLTGACQTGCLEALKSKGMDGSPMTAHDVKRHFPEWGQKLLDVLEWE